jgi:hypothetical protein
VEVLRVELAQLVVAAVRGSESEIVS